MSEQAAAWTRLRNQLSHSGVLSEAEVQHLLRTLIAEVRQSSSDWKSTQTMLLTWLQADSVIRDVPPGWALKRLNTWLANYDASLLDAGTTAHAGLVAAKASPSSSEAVVEDGGVNPVLVVQTLCMVLIWLVVLTMPMWAMKQSPAAGGEADAYDAILAAIAVPLTLALLAKYKHKS